MSCNLINQQQPQIPGPPRLDRQFGTDTLSQGPYGPLLRNRMFAAFIMPEDVRIANLLAARQLNNHFSRL